MLSCFRCVWLCNPMDCSLRGSSTHWISQARMLEWVAISYSRGSPQPREWIRVSLSPALAGGFFTTEAPGKPHASGCSIKLSEPLRGRRGSEASIQPVRVGDQAHPAWFYENTFMGSFTTSSPRLPSWLSERPTGCNYIPGPRNEGMVRIRQCWWSRGGGGQGWDGGAGRGSREGLDEWGGEGRNNIHNRIAYHVPGMVWGLSLILISTLPEWY